jgi:hypothetical protein
VASPMPRILFGLVTSASRRPACSRPPAHLDFRTRHSHAVRCRAVLSALEGSRDISSGGAMVPAWLGAKIK